MVRIVCPYTTTLRRLRVFQELLYKSVIFNARQEGNVALAYVVYRLSAVLGSLQIGIFSLLPLPLLFAVAAAVVTSDSLTSTLPSCQKIHKHKLISVGY